MCFKHMTFCPRIEFEMEWLNCPRLDFHTSSIEEAESPPSKVFPQSPPRNGHDGPRREITRNRRARSRSGNSQFYLLNVYVMLPGYGDTKAHTY